MLDSIADKELIEEIGRRFGREVETALVTAIGIHRCGRCAQFKPISEFYRDHKAPRGIGYVCKSCDKTRPSKNAARRAKTND